MALDGRVASFLSERGRQKGLLGDSSTWLGVWVLMLGARWVVRMAAREPVVVRETLRPGEQLVIRHFAPTEVVPDLPIRRKGRKA